MIVTESFSLYVSQLVYFGLCAPGFVAQFLPFMQKYKVQQVKHRLLPILFTL